MDKIIIDGNEFLYKQEVGNTYFHEVKESTRIIPHGGNWSWKKFKWLDLVDTYHKELFYISIQIDSPYNTKEKVQREIKKEYIRYLELEERRKEIEETKLLIID